MTTTCARCSRPATWRFRTGNGILRYACGIHLHTLLGLDITFSGTTQGRHVECLAGEAQREEWDRAVNGLRRQRADHIADAGKMVGG